MTLDKVFPCPAGSKAAILSGHEFMAGLSNSFDNLMVLDLRKPGVSVRQTLEV